MYVPSKLFFTRGVGQHKEKLASFEMALRKCGIAHFNLVRVSSILPPRCRIVKKETGLKELKPGQIVPEEGPINSKSGFHEMAPFHGHQGVVSVSLLMFLSDEDIKRN